MSHTNILFPHPVLRPGGIDYVDCNFNMDIKQAVHTSDGRIHLELSYNLSSSTINDLLKEKKVKFFAVLKCTKTYQRIISSSADTSMTWNLSLSDYAGALNITPYITTIEKIPSFISNEHDAEIKQLTPNGVDLPIGAILAVGNPHEITLDLIEKIQAAIIIVKDDSIKEGYYFINTDSNYITVRMHPNTRNHIQNIRDKFPNVLYPSIYLAALEHAISNMEEDPDRKWVQALRKTLEDYNIEINYEDLKQNAHEHAQTILKKPLNRLIQWGEQSDDFD